MRTYSASAVYIHIPFCTNKCHYCDFNSYVLKGQPVMDYIDALEREMELTVKKHPPKQIQTIFVGGGTPTVLTPEQMEAFLRIVNDYFPDRTNDLEFSMEANPGTTDLEKLHAMKEGGVNRISFGVQSFNDKLLEEIGRIHNVKDVYRSIENARSAGFNNLSLDLMFGLPNQTVQDMEHSLQKAFELNLLHYSIYSLKIEENTLFHTLYEKNQLLLPNEDDELDMYLLIMRRMKEAGYEQYEISNFAKPGYSSKHNTMYWKNRYYYGLGAGAHGYMDGFRHVNIKGVQPYIERTKQGLPILEAFEVSKEEAMEDFMMVGLRMMDGVSGADFYEQFGTSMENVFGQQLHTLTERGLLEVTQRGYRLSSQGILYGNDVFAAFI